MQAILVYLGLYWGIFVSGEFVFTAAVIAAKQGHFNFWLVIGIGFFATWLPDILFYEMGRRKGTKWLSEKQEKSAGIRKASQLLKAHENVLLLAYRFIYGFRTALLLLIGSQFSNQRKFLFFSFIAVSTWVSIYAALGMLFGTAISNLLDEIKGAEFYIIGGLLAITFVFGVRKYLIRREV